MLDTASRTTKVRAFDTLPALPLRDDAPGQGLSRGSRDPPRLRRVKEMLMTTIMGFTISVLDLIFPPLTDQKLQEIVKSIKERGLHLPIILWRGQVIDGGQWLRACLEAGVEPVFDQIPDDADPVEYIMNLNDRRRHMNESQRSIAAYKVWEESSNGWRALGDIGSANLHSYTLEEVATRGST